MSIAPFLVSHDSHSNAKLAAVQPQTVSRYRWVRNTCLGSWVLSAILFNVLATTLIASGAVLTSVRFILAAVRGVWIPGHILGRAGYPGGLSATAVLMLLVPNLALQGAMVCAAVATLSPRLLCASFVGRVWREIVLFGLPLVAVVFLYDVISFFIDDDSSLLVLICSWALYCYCSALLVGRRMLRRWWRGMLGICPRCRYGMAGKPMIVCPECGFRLDCRPCAESWEDPIIRWSDLEALFICVVGLFYVIWGLRSMAGAPIGSAEAPRQWLFAVTAFLRLGIGLVHVIIGVRFYVQAALVLVRTRMFRISAWSCVVAYVIATSASGLLFIHEAGESVGWVLAALPNFLPWIVAYMMPAISLGLLVVTRAKSQSKSSVVNGRVPREKPSASTWATASSGAECEPVMHEAAVPDHNAGDDRADVPH